MAFAKRAALFCILACVGDMAITTILGYFYKGYNPFIQSQSYLGTSDSPVALYMNTWGVCFTILFLLYAYYSGKTAYKRELWEKIAGWLIVVYGLGEGAGSGLFPYNHIGNELTLSARLHNVCSGMGDFALVLLPFALLKGYPRYRSANLHVYIWFVAVSGPVLIILYVLATRNIITLKGLWQRLFILDYYLLLLVLAINRLHSTKREKLEDHLNY
ncbi:MAG: DUF998 domain-containing protein [Bacteroidetes bacterium]|nr:DUF998 domain-containing protein [Bacteroidota bacterium]